MISPSAIALTALLLRFTMAQNNFEIIGGEAFAHGLVSAQQMFLGSENTVYIIDKAEGIPTTQIGGHPAWASSYDLSSNTARPMDVVTNTFCASGTSLADGRWINVGGNNQVGLGGQNGNYTFYPSYGDTDGGNAIRVLTPCNDNSCNWDDDATAMGTTAKTWRWYPSLATLKDGSAIIIGGDQYGGFVNNIDGSQNNPTYEFYPSRGEAQNMQFLTDSLPANLYPLTWLTPSGNLFIQAGWMAITFDPDTGVETPYANVTHAVRTYPASAATVMLPQNKANNWTAPIMFCGGADIQDAEWEANQADNAWFRKHPLSASCVRTSPDTDPTWTDDDDMLEPRSMGNFIYLPDGRIWLGNGIASGVAGYDSTGVPFGTSPIYTPAIYDPSQPAGSKWTRKGLQKANLPRLYHSSAILAADGSVVVAGSNPYADFQANGSMITAGPKSAHVKAEWWTELRLEKFYPDYYNEARPSPSNLPTSISYGGQIMSVTLSASDMAGVKDTSDVRFTLVRTGFSTHAINFGQQFVELETSLTKNSDGSAILNVAPLPPNAAVLAPGPAMAYVLVQGVPSIGTMVMIGSGSIGQQPTADYPTLPTTSGFSAKTPATQSVSDSRDNTSSAASISLSALSLILTLFATVAGRL